MTDINTQWFRDKLAERKMSQRGLARAMGLDAAAVSLMLRGKREMKLREAAEVARLMGVPAEDILQHAGIKMGSSGTRLEICGVMDGTAEVKWGNDLGTVAAPVGIEANGAIQCRTQGTQLDYMDRWLLYFIGPRKDGVAPEALERLAVVKIQDGCTGIGQVRRGYQPGRWDVSGPAIMLRDVRLEYAVPILLIQT